MRVDQHVAGGSGSGCEAGHYAGRECLFAVATTMSPLLMIVLMIMTMMILMQAMHGDRMGPPQALPHIAFHTALFS